jgi:hypothetical protein
MNSKVDQLENQPDLVDELTDFFKNLTRRKQKDKDKDKEITLHEYRNKFTANTNYLESDKRLRKKIIIEIDLNQRTTVFSNDHSMWV